MNALENEVDGELFLEKLIIVYEKGELDFWEERNNPPNLSKDDFDIVLYKIGQVDNLKWPVRKSQNGPHGKTGEDHCFQFNCTVEFGGIFGSTIKTYYIKGYYFDKGNLKGVTIQSFREV